MFKITRFILNFYISLNALKTVTPLHPSWGAPVQAMLLCAALSWHKKIVMLLNWERSRGVFMCQGLTLPNDAKLHHYFLRAIWLVVLDRHAVCQWLPVRQLQCALSLGESSISPVLTVITLHAWLTLSVNARTLAVPAELFHRSSICFWLLLFNSFCFRLNGQCRIKPFFRIIYKPIIYGMLGNYFSWAVFTALINDQLDCLKVKRPIVLLSLEVAAQRERKLTVLSAKAGVLNFDAKDLQIRWPRNI